VEKAEELRKVLETLGFEPDHIRTLYNENATAEKINASLTDFWTGGAFEGAGRFFSISAVMELAIKEMAI